MIACNIFETKDGNPSPRKLIVLITPTLVDEAGHPYRAAQPGL